MLDLLRKNREMLDNHIYKLSDERTMLKVDSLDNPNDYDLYLIACCLCNYPLEAEEKADARKLRMDLFLATDNGSVLGFEHAVTDYNKTSSSVKCKNTGNINKYGLYEYEISVNDSNLVSDFWDAKSRNCLKFVDSKTYDDKLIVSISRDQLDNFIKLLDAYMIQYDLDDIESGLFYKNKSTSTLVDLSTLTLPFTPYSYQLEDAEKIIKKKRVLLGHEMGCFIGTTKVLLANGSYVEIKDLSNTTKFLVNSYDIETKQFVSKLAIAKKTRENADLLRVTYTNMSICNKTDFEICCTPDHKFLVNLSETMIWIEAKDLQTNMKLVSETNTIQITNTEILDNKEDVYCLTVDDTHNFAIDGGVIVHNCGKTFISILVGCSIFNKEDVIYRTLDNLEYTDIVITDKGPLPIGKIVEENINCKVQVTKNGVTKFVNILDRKRVDL